MSSSFLEIYQNPGKGTAIDGQISQAKNKEYKMSDYSSANGIVGALLGSFLIVLIISLVVTIFFAIVYWKIFAKAGYSGAMGLLMFIPIANLIVLCVLAFGEWPIYKELNALRAQPPRSPQYIPTPQYPSSPQYPQYGQQPPRYP